MVGATGRQVAARLVWDPRAEPEPPVRRVPAAAGPRGAAARTAVPAEPPCKPVVLRETHGVGIGRVRSPERRPVRDRHAPRQDRGERSIICRRRPLQRDQYQPAPGRITRPRPVGRAPHATSARLARESSCVPRVPTRVILEQGSRRSRARYGSHPSGGRSPEPAHDWAIDAHRHSVMTWDAHNPCAASDPRHASNTERDMPGRTHPEFTPN